jgi:putative protease
MEVLAPAGSVDALKAAVLGGADAVYLGGRRFGARKFAPNLSDEEMAGALEYAHDRRVRIYVTVNTLIKEREMEEALSYVATLEDMGADAVIVQDRGLLRALRRELRVPVHASTQMGIHTPEGARWAEQAGIERVILARELSLEEIAGIRKASGVELEVFVHGALCYCFSGQCLFSSFAGGRSGNRGACAQPCRKSYVMGERQGYLLSTADLFCVDAIPDLLRIGVQGLKIEGRMRSPIYVYLASKAYSNAVKRAMRGEQELITPRERELLAVAFNRGFSRGYLMEGEVMQRAYPDSRGLPLGGAEARSGLLSPFPPGLEVGDGLTLFRGQEKIGGFEVTSRHVSEGELRPPFPLMEGPYLLYKTKDSEFPAIESAIGNASIEPRPVQRARRSLHRPFSARSPREPELSAIVSSLRGMEAALPYVDRIYYEHAERMEEAEGACQEAGLEFVPLLPRASPVIPEVGQGAVMVCSADQAYRYRDRRLFGHHSMNAFNGLALDGIYQCMASVELGRDDLRELLSRTDSRVEVLAFGKVELMVTRDASIAQGMLRDPAGRGFPVYRDRHGFAHILNSADLMLLEFAEDLGKMGVDSLAMDLRRRDPDLVALVTKAFRERDTSSKGAIKRRCGAITVGHYLKGVD